MSVNWRSEYIKYPNKNHYQLFMFFSRLSKIFLIMNSSIIGIHEEYLPEEQVEWKFARKSISLYKI